MLFRVFSTILSLTLALPFASALTVDTPQGWTSADRVNITWEVAAGDPAVFSIELTNTAFHNTFAIANNVPATESLLNVLLPIVPVGDGYTLEFVNVTNINQVFASSQDFSVGPTTSSTSSGTSTTNGTTTLSANGTASATLTGSNTQSLTSPGTTATSTSSTPSATPSTFSNGAAALALSHNSVAGLAILIGAALAGARLL